VVSDVGRELRFYSEVFDAREVEDPDRVAALDEKHGAESLIPVSDRAYGRRDSPLRDPFGHVWIIGRPAAVAR